MSEKTDLSCIFVAVLALLSLAAGPALAGTVTQSFSYQGTLTDAAGKPLTGMYPVTFTIYDADTGGNVLSTDWHTVNVKNGQFVTQVEIQNPVHLNGQALWLGIKVHTDPEMTPRLEIRPVPYAFSLRPGAYMVTDDNSRQLEFLGQGSAAQIAYVTGEYKEGMRVILETDHSTGVESRTQGYGNRAIFAYTLGDDSDGIYVQTGTRNSDGVEVSTAGDYSRGFSAETEGDNSEGIEVSTSGTASPGVDIRTEGAISPGVRVTTDESPGIEVNTLGPGIAGIGVRTSDTASAGISVSTIGGSSDGVTAEASGLESIGVRGESDQYMGVRGKGVWGGYFETNQAGSGDFIPNGIGVYAPYDNNRGISVSTSGLFSPGIDVRTQQAVSPGVRVTTRESPGIEVKTTGSGIPGVYVSTSETASVGISASTIGGSSDGVSAVASGPGSRGVYGESAKAAGIYGKGVWGGYFVTNGPGEGSYIPNGIAVSTSYEKNRGIIVSTSGPTSPGVVAETANRNSHALTGSAAGEQSNGVVAYSTQWTAIYADTLREDHGYGLYTPDDIYARQVVSPSVDVAEYMPVSQDVAPGTVLVIGKGGVLAPSATAYDTHVAGIVSTLPGVALGNDGNGNPGQALVAVAGRVPCLADASNGPIAEGDLLTTSARPGHAMRADPVTINGIEIYRPGTVLGKAMGILESGTGTIEVLVTLQ